MSEAEIFLKIKENKSEVLGYYYVRSPPTPTDYPLHCTN